MNTIRRFRIILMVLVLGIMAQPQRAPGAFVFGVIDGNEEFTSIRWNDAAAGRTVWWVLKNTAPFFTVDVNGTSGWSTAELIGQDGALWVLWFRTSGTNLEVGIWRIVNGALSSAASYTTSGWSLASLDLVGEKFLLGFFDGAGNRAYWILGTAGNIDATLFHAIAGAGLSTGVVNDSEDMGRFVIVYVNFATGHTTLYLFDKDGNWLAANSYQA